jgi:hypothetical protein
LGAYEKKTILDEVVFDPKGVDIFGAQSNISLR